MSAIYSTNESMNVLDWAALVAVVLAALLFGSNPLWISGFSAAAFCVLGAAHIAACVWKRTSPFPFSRVLMALALVLPAWLACTVLRDAWLDASQMRAPALSLRSLPWAFAFLGAALLGSRFGGTKIRFLQTALAVCGTLLAFAALADYFGAIHIAAIATPSGALRRATGLLGNANRFAVMQALCGSCALGLLTAAVRSSARTSGEIARRYASVGVLGAVSLLIFASLALTLSRLTIIAFGCSLAVVAGIWIARARPDNEARFADKSLGDRVQAIAVACLPLIVLAGWLAWALGVGNADLNSRFGMMHYGNSAGPEDRLMGLKAALPLIEAQPVFGAGLGNFEYAFTRVQPAALPGRWNRLHNDWVQLAVEGGIPALLLSIALTVFFVAAWWRNVRRFFSERDDPRALLLLGGFAGILTALVCGAGDFPFHEPAVALAFMMLAGALAAPDTNDSAVSPPGRFTGMPAVTSIGCMLGCAFVAGRNSMAVAATPWFGQRLYPPASGSDIAAWEHGMRIDPDEPLLHYFAADAVSNDEQAGVAKLEQAREHLRRARELLPLDFHVAWLHGRLAERLDDDDDAAAQQERAIALCPENAGLYLDAGVFQLRRRTAPFAQGSLQRDAGRSAALRYFREALRLDPRYDLQIAAWMEGSGLGPDEIVPLWPDNTPAGILSRARFWCGHDAFAKAGAELKNMPVNQSESGFGLTVWYYLLRGTVDERREAARAEEKGPVQGIENQWVRDWSTALAMPTFQADPVAVEWLLRGIERLQPPAALKLAGTDASKFQNFPQLINALARKLTAGGMELEAVEFLEKSGSEVDYNQRLWAELSFETGDLVAAAEHAQNAMRAHNRNQDDYWDWSVNLSHRIEDRAKVKPPGRP